MKYAMVMLSLLALFLAGTAEATQTKIVVRAKAKDAKFIGTSMGGALVVVKDSETGEVLAKGFTAGSTGNTNRIMLEPVRRGVMLSDGATAKFESVIDIDQPKFVTVEVYSPYSQRQSMTRNTTQLWLIPGKDVTGDGVVVEVPGFVVDITSPASPDGVKLSAGKALLPIKATVTTMCGCIITPGGTWDSQKYEIAAIVKLEGKVIGTAPLKYADKASYFEGTVEVTKEGLYELVIYAYDPSTGNTGLDKTTFTVY